MTMAMTDDQWEERRAVRRLMAATSLRNAARQLRTLAGNYRLAGEDGSAPKFLERATIGMADAALGLLFTWKAADAPEAETAAMEVLNEGRATAQLIWGTADVPPDSYANEIRPVATELQTINDLREALYRAVILLEDHESDDDVRVRREYRRWLRPALSNIHHAATCVCWALRSCETEPEWRADLWPSSYEGTHLTEAERRLNEMRTLIAIHDKTTTAGTSAENEVAE